ncbi:DUF6114 domain-containing protein [Actinoplanes sp. NPDC051861]|uniref:DUF6114 domain-containing protein n=1 Tax=Actinoplanes sp. NPDC051861 TaxID=3155170 RepID=UPI00341C0955
MDDFRSEFRTWRRGRPYWGGLFLVMSGLEMFTSANMELADLQLHIGPQGFLSYLLPVIMLVCGALAWFTPAQRLFYGIVGTLTALYSFIGLNLGGWFAGMFLGILGGALVIAWTPAERGPEKGIKPYKGTGDAPTGEIPVISDSTIVPGIVPGDGSHQEQPPGNHRTIRKALIFIVPLAMAGTLLAATGAPADAAECPKGLPSIAPKAAAKSATPKPKKSRTPSPAPSAGAPAGGSASPSPTATEDDGTGFPILDGIGDVIEDIGEWFDPDKDEETPSPSPSAPATAPTATPTSAPAESPTATPKPSKKPEEIPCLGPRQEGLVANADGLPRAAVKPGLMKVGSLTMYNSTYEGVTDVPTANGVIPSLRFVMDKAVNKPFSLEIDEPGDATTLIKSNELITDGSVEFYTPKFAGKLFGLIPVTFTPESPPPLTLPVLWFTDVTIDLAYVQCDVLTADPIKITES